MWDMPKPLSTLNYTKVWEGVVLESQEDGPEVSRLEGAKKHDASALLEMVNSLRMHSLATPSRVPGISKGGHTILSSGIQDTGLMGALGYIDSDPSMIRPPVHQCGKQGGPGHCEAVTVSLVICGVPKKLLIRGSSRRRGNNLLNEASASVRHPSPRLPRELTSTQWSTGRTKITLQYARNT
jgi:hypothetical protein